VPVNLRTDGRPGDAQRSQQCHLQASLASALGGTVLTSQTIMLAGYAYPSLAAYGSKITYTPMRRSVSRLTLRDDNDRNPVAGALAVRLTRAG
jgi:hypothetical protein